MLCTINSFIRGEREKIFSTVYLFITELINFSIYFVLTLKTDSL
jgi:hypothetical protein